MYFFRFVLLLKVHVIHVVQRYLVMFPLFTSSTRLDNKQGTCRLRICKHFFINLRENGESIKWKFSIIRFLGTIEQV